MYINKLVDEFIERTEGLTTEGLVSEKVATGTYEIHLKPYHLPEVKGLNLYSTQELAERKYLWMTPKEVGTMQLLDEFPMSIRTVFKDDDGTHLLSDSYMYLTDLPDDSDIEDTIDYDYTEIDRLIKGG